MLTSNFDMKDIGEANVILGIKISRITDGLVLSQSHYTEKILNKFSEYDTDPVKTPYVPNLHLRKNDGQGISQVEYARIIGSLMYLMNCTRPDIAYSVNKLSRYTSNLGKDHWKAIITVLKYLRYIKDLDHKDHWKAIVMQIRYLILKTRNPQVDMSLRLAV